MNKLPVKLEQESNRQVKVWTNEARLGTQLTLPKVYKQEDLPITVYVEPLEASEEERDLVFKVGCRFEKLANSSGTEKRWVEAIDRLKMTVVKVEIVVDLEDPMTNNVRSGLKQDTLKFDLNGNVISNSNLTLQPTTVTVDDEQITTKLKIIYVPSCNELNLPGSNTVKVDIDDMVDNHMDQVVNVFQLP